MKMILGAFAALMAAWFITFSAALEAVEKPRGVFASAGAAGNPNDATTIYGDTTVRGVLIRVMWSAIEPTPGSYDFSLLTTQINNAKSKGLSWSLAVLGGGIGSPAWLTNSTGQGGLGVPYVNYSFRGVSGYRLPLFWNATVQTRLQLLASRLATQYNGDSALKLVYVTQMTANGIEGHVQGVSMTDLVAAGYTDANWIAAAEQSARNFAYAFTNKAIAFEVHEINGGATVPGTIINDLWNDAALGQRVGAAMWWISGRTNYQPDLLAVLAGYPGDIYGQVIANSDTTSEFPNGDYTAAFAQAKQLLMRYIEPWDYEFTNLSTGSSNRRYDGTFADFNAWADTTFAGGIVVKPPVITTPPSSQMATAGGTVTFAVVAGGTAPLSYQWKLGGVVITGAVSSTLTLTNVQSGAAGTYSVTVSNSAGSATSNGVSLIVESSPTPAQPQPVASQSGSSGGGGAIGPWGALLCGLGLLLRCALGNTPGRAAF